MICVTSNKTYRTTRRDTPHKYLTQPARLDANARCAVQERKPQRARRNGKGLASVMHKYYVTVDNSSSLTKRGSTYAWRAIRKAVIDRDGCCLNCGNIDNLEVDHIIERQYGGDDSLTNLQTLCKTCHQAKTTKSRVFGSNETPTTPPCRSLSPTLRSFPSSPFASPFEADRG